MNGLSDFSSRSAALMTVVAGYALFVAALSGCSDGDTAANDEALSVLFSGGPSMSGFSDVEVGDPATLGLPYVCSTTVKEVRVTGVELIDAEPALEVTRWVVAGQPGAPARIAPKSIAQLPQGREASPFGVVTASCEANRSVQMWIEVQLTEPGSARATSVRYSYRVDDGEEQRTASIPAGVGLSTDKFEP